MPDSKRAVRKHKTKRRPDPVDIAVGRTVWQIRDNRGFSRRVLAEHLGVTWQQVEKYEKGANRMGASTLWRIAAFFDLEVGELFQDVEHGDDPANGNGDGKPRLRRVAYVVGEGSSAATDGEISKIASDYHKISDRELRKTVGHLIERLTASPSTNGQSS